MHALSQIYVDHFSLCANELWGTCIYTANVDYGSNERDECYDVCQC